MNETEWSREIRSKRCAVLGIGISNLPLIRFLLSRGAVVTARDRKSRAELGDTVAQLEAAGAKIICGDAYLADLNEEILFRSPGIRPDTPEIASAVARGAILTSEMETFLRLTPATTVGVTGSDGKTTTTTLTGLILSEVCRARGRGRVFVGGNIGEPLLSKVGEMTADDFAVVELSSFQLQEMPISTSRAAVTNVTPNHLNWHTGMEEYTEAKKNIYRHAENHLLAVNAENPATREMGERCTHPVTWFSSVRHAFSEFPARPGDRAVYTENGMIVLSDGQNARPVFPAGGLLLPGRHNLENLMTAIALTDGIAAPDAIRRVATTFPGVRHRLECLGTHCGVTYYNSSIDSSPTRTAAALSALAEKKIRPIVICGGYDKHIPFAPLAKALYENAKAVVLTGATAGQIRAALDVAGEECGRAFPVYAEPDFTRAARLAHDIAAEGDTVLLSPACASFDAFRNFEERGDRFREIVATF